MVDGLGLQMSALELCRYFVCHVLRKESPTLQPVELILVLFLVRKGDFLDDDLGVDQTWKIEYKKRFTVIPMYSICSRGRRLSLLNVEQELGMIASSLET